MSIVDINYIKEVTRARKKSTHHEKNKRIFWYTGNFFECFIPEKCMVQDFFNFCEVEFLLGVQGF